MDNENTIIDVTPENPTGVIRNMTVEEIAQRETDNANTEIRKQEYETAKQADADNKTSGNTKLLGLGLTQAEATALTGYTLPIEE